MEAGLNDVVNVRFVWFKVATGARVIIGFLVLTVSPLGLTLALTEWNARGKCTLWQASGESEAALESGLGTRCRPAAGALR